MMGRAWRWFWRRLGWKFAKHDHRRGVRCNECDRQQRRKFNQWRRLTRTGQHHARVTGWKHRGGGWRLR